MDQSDDGTPADPELIPEQVPDESWLSDDPLAPGLSEGGYLDRRVFVGAMSDVIVRARAASMSTVFGLIGPWGIGKSTILDDLSSRLQKSSPASWIVRPFNPWLYSDAQSLQWGFFSELRDALPKDEQWTDTKKLFTTLRSVTVPLASVIGMFGPDPTNLVGSLFDQANPSLTATKDKIAIKLKKLPTPILMVLDDLDRLTSGELLEVFKLVRFLGRLPNVYYLLSYDERTLKDLIENTELVGREPGRRALDYLEKIIQIRFDIPRLREDQAEQEFGRAMGVLLGINSIDRARNDEVRLMNEFSQRLVRRISTPRALQRFVGQIEAFLPSVRDEVDWVDFIFLSWIRTFEPGLYEQMQHSKQLLLGHGSPLSYAGADKTEEKFLAFHEMLDLADVSPHYVADVIGLLGELFPAIKLVEAKKSTKGLSDVRSKRIANSDYFDRYFQFGVPKDDIADSTVAAALRAIERDQSSDDLDELESHLQVDTIRTIRKIEELRAHGSAVAAATAKWIAKMYARLPDAQLGFWTGADYLENVFAKCLSDAGTGSSITVLQESQENKWFARLAADAVSQMATREIGGSDEVDRWKTIGKALIPEFVAVATRAFDEFDDSVPVIDIPTKLWVSVYRWVQLDEESMRSYVASRLIDGGWDVLDFLSRLVNVAIPLGVPNAIGHIEGFDEAFVSKFLDLDDATARLNESLINIAPLPEGYEIPATTENLRLKVLHSLRARRDRE